MAPPSVLPFYNTDSTKSVSSSSSNSSFPFNLPRKVKMRSIFVLVLLSLIYLLATASTPTWAQTNQQAMIVDGDEGMDVVDGGQAALSNTPEKLGTEEASNEYLTMRELKGIVAQHTVVVFSKTYCPYSQNAKRILNRFSYKENMAPYVVEVDLRGKSNGLRAGNILCLPECTYPNVFIAGKSIGGSDDVSRLDDKGELEKMLSAAGVLNVDTGAKIPGPDGDADDE
ncbi:hypothetical protein BZG36_00176 [Bifiguratus adelaidae]|uniref:Glutaredoxin domain-containing protein n=1 Tax=Bifiguratus adelaidae TaxID=1938954 RepID=A0A261Y8N6_9FUNG|nr:hypothetical protein BZG36_00176 [Bifiguratus adelaidae]